MRTNAHRIEARSEVVGRLVDIFRHHNRAHQEQTGQPHGMPSRRTWKRTKS